MRSSAAPATVVICCGVPAGTSPAAVAPWTNLAARSRMPITWVCGRDVLPTVLAGVADEQDVALDLDAAHVACRPALRREIAAARERVGNITSIVVSGTPCLDHRSLLVEQGIQTVAVGGFEHATRSSRRPPPAGWQCRSIVWGLWEVRTVPRPPRRAMAWMLAGFAGPRLAPGSLTVVHIDPVVIGERQARGELERLIAWVGRRPVGVRAARLGDLPGLLHAGGQPETGSVLRRAA